MTNPFEGIVLDSRPMFNGEYRAFIRVLQLMPRLDGFISIGAREDSFYIDMLYDRKCILVEPNEKSADDLQRYITKWAFQNKYIERNGIHPTDSSISVTQYGSIFPRKSLYETKQALDSGVIVCPYTKRDIDQGSWEQGSQMFHSNCISPRHLIEKYSLAPEFIKIDVEGAEKMIIESLISSGTRPSFIQYEYGVTWFHAGVTMESMFTSMPGYYHYVLSPSKMTHIVNPSPQYFYCNFLASRFFLGEEVAF
jgi:FkbM family methyltransferase